MVDEACTIIQDLSLSSGNYKRAVELLKKRFADTRVVILANMDVLLSSK